MAAVDHLRHPRPDRFAAVRLVRRAVGIRHRRRQPGLRRDDVPGDGACVRLALETADPGLEQAARSLGAGRLDRLLNVTLPLASPGILVGGIVAYATCLGEFGAVITFAANIPGQTQTLPLAIYAALQVPGGEAKAAELSLVSLLLAAIGLLLSEWISKRLNAALGR